MLDLHFDVTLGSFRAAINLSTPSGETTVVLGESGSGKTTVLRVLAGLLSPQQGLLVLDDDVYLDTDKGIAVPTQDRPIGYVFQDYALFPHLSVYDNIAFGLKMQRMPKTEVRQRVAQALTQAHLVGYDDRRPRELSGGQQQRVAIARALALRPRLLLLDESLSALDIQTRHQVVRELREILADLGLTSVMVSHQYSDALNLAHHIMVLERGLVIQEGTHLDLLQHPRSSYIAELTGVNRFEGTIVATTTPPALGGFGSRQGAVAMIEVEGVRGIGSDRDDGLSVGAPAIVVVHPRNVQLGATIPSHPGRQCRTVCCFPGHSGQRQPVGGRQANGGLVAGRHPRRPASAHPYRGHDRRLIQPHDALRGGPGVRLLFSPRRKHLHE